MINRIAKIVAINLALVLMLTLTVGAAPPVKKEISAGELQGLVKKIHEYAYELRKLARKMGKPAHSIPCEIGGKIHDQYHRIESLVSIVYENVEELEELVEEPKKNKDRLRELVVHELYGQLGRRELGKLVTGMSELVDKALSADGEAAQKLQDILDKLEHSKDRVLKQVKRLAAKLQEPIVWEYRKSRGVHSSHRLANGNTLISEYSADRVIEVTPDKKIVWKYSGDSKGLESPSVSRRLKNGNTLIGDQGNRRIIEVTPDKKIVWKYSKGLKTLCDVERLKNGNILISDLGMSCVIEVTPDKKIVWKYSGDTKGLKSPSVAERLKNGNTLICDWGNHRMIEVTPNKKIVWEYNKLKVPWGGQRLGNGNTLITDYCGYVIEVTPDKETVWKYGAIEGPCYVERLENGNTLIAVFGENRVIEVAAP